MTTKITTKFGAVKTATRHPYIIVAAPRMYAGGLGFEYGEAFIVGYAMTTTAAFKRIRRLAGGGTALALYHVATGTEVHP